MAPSQAEATPVQRFVYLMAKDENTPEELKKNGPAQMNQGQNLIDGF